MSDLVKKSKIVPFIDSTPSSAATWVQIKKSTTFTLSMNPQTKTYDFIADEQPVTEIDSYQPSLAQSLTMFKGEPDYENMFDMLFDEASGEKAHRKMLVVFYQEKGSYTPAQSETAVDCWKAWQPDATISFNQLDSVNQSIDFDCNFGNKKKGAVTVSDGVPTFIEGTWSGTTFTPATVSASSTPANGDTTPANGDTTPSNNTDPVGQGG